MDQELPFPIYLFPVFFATLWCLILFALTCASGWPKLAKRFGFEGRFKGKRFNFQSARVNWIRFGGSMVIGCDERGMFLVPFLPFRLFATQLLIPWDSVRSSEYKRLFYKGVKLTFPEVPEVTIDMPQRQFAKIVAARPVRHR